MEKKKNNKKKGANTVEINVDTMKNVIIVVLSVVAVIGISCAVSANSGKKYSKESETSTTESDNSGQDASSAIQQESESISDEERAELEEISVNEYLDLMDADEPSVIYVMRTGCSWCALEDPIMEHIKYQYSDAPIYRLDIANFEDDDSSNFADSDDMFSGDNWGTPTTIVVKGGKIVDSLSGAGTSDALLELFKNNGIISE